MPQTLPSNIDSAAFFRCTDALAANARELAIAGWTPATSSNFSMRLDAKHVVVTVSGRDKGQLGRDDFMLVDVNGQPVHSSARPSAETALHTQLYRLDPERQVVLHTHSRTQSVASRLFAAKGVVRLQGWELQKAIRGYRSHDDVLELPVFANTQHMPELVDRIDAWCTAGKPLPAYLIDGHGIYAWGQDMTEARRQLEALEFLLGCELELRRFSA